MAALMPLIKPRSTPSKLATSKSAHKARGTAQINVVPQHAPHLRPARQLFIFGNGNFGQFGLGTDTLGEIARPRLHAWFESAVQSGVLGGDGAGIEQAYAGGMHTLVIDEAGKVYSHPAYLSSAHAGSLQVWSWGVNDSAALGRPTVNVPDPDNDGEFIETEILETQPMAVKSLDDEGFRAVKIVAGDSISVALGSKGELRAWGSFRVRISKGCLCLAYNTAV